MCNWVKGRGVVAESGDYLAGIDMPPSCSEGEEEDAESEDEKEADDVDRESDLGAEEVGVERDSSDAELEGGGRGREVRTGSG